MATIGIELCDAGLLAASCTKDDPRIVEVPDKTGATAWPGFCYCEGDKLSFGLAAEDMWFIHPRRVAHNFWSRLNLEPSSLLVGKKPPSFSELAFLFLRTYAEQLRAATGPIEKVVLALPGSYLKDAATEEEKIGLVLGMAGELYL